MTDRTQSPASPAQAQPSPGGRRIVLAAGGTGGHFFPAEALAALLIARGHAIALLTDARGAARAGQGIFAGHPVHTLAGAGIAGKSAAGAARAGVSLAFGSLRARSLLRGLHPSAIIGFGGYPSFPPIMGSRLLRRRVPIVLHEQNAVLGRANRALARTAACLAVSFAETKLVPPGLATRLTGNPVRPAILAAAAIRYTPPDAGGPIRLLVTGGSQGARAFADIIPATLASLPASLIARLYVTQQCRAEDLDAVAATYREARITADTTPFIEAMGPALAAATLVIGRAGASTLAELAVVGRPAILVPLPGAIDDHQAANAAAFGPGGFVLRQEQFSLPNLRTLLLRLLETPGLLAEAAAAAAQSGHPDAAERLADLIANAIAGGAA